MVNIKGYVASLVDVFYTYFREKYHAYSYENPIRDAAVNQCSDKLSHLTEPYVKSLTGKELLNILCEKNCSFTEPKPSYGMIVKIIYQNIIISNLNLNAHIKLLAII